MTASIWAANTDDFFPLSVLGPVTIGLLIQIVPADPIILQVRGDTGWGWVSAMPPGVTTLGGTLTYIHIARGFEYRLFSPTGDLVADTPICISPV